MLRFFLKTGTPFNNGSMMLKKELFDNFRHDTTLKVGSDSDMVFQVTPNTRSIHLGKPLYIYRLHSKSISRSHNQSERMLHVQKLLARHEIEDLVPEIDWSSGEIANNQARAYAIVSLLLYRRGMLQIADEWLTKALALECSVDEKLFIRAVSLMQNGSYELANQVLTTCSAKDHIIDNYLGEIAALTGNTNSAYGLFLEALEKNPYYFEPVDNLRALGGLSSLQLVDNTWMKFKKAS
jgi:tetratricopeptide (TPR) repeat protein